MRTLIALVFSGLVLSASASHAGLTAYWSFEGDFDDSVGGNLTTPSGSGFIFSPNTPSALGASGTALDFGSTNNTRYLDIPESVINLNEGTVALWLNSAGNTPLHYAFASQNDSVGNRVYINTDGTNLNGSLDTPFNNISARPIASNTWHHVANVWRTDDTGTQYLNGSPANASSPVTLDNVLQVQIGRNGANNDQLWEGLLDDVAIWDRALSQSEINALTNLPTNIPTLDVTEVDALFELHLQGADGAVEERNWQFVDDAVFFAGRDPGEVFNTGTGFAVLLDPTNFTGLMQEPPLTPEPGTFALFAAILGVAGGCAWRKRRLAA